MGSTFPEEKKINTNHHSTSCTSDDRGPRISNDWCFRCVSRSSASLCSFNSAFLSRFSRFEKQKWPKLWLLPQILGLSSEFYPDLQKKISQGKIGLPTWPAKPKNFIFISRVVHFKPNPQPKKTIPKPKPMPLDHYFLIQSVKLGIPVRPIWSCRKFFCQIGLLENFWKFFISKRLEFWKFEMPSGNEPLQEKCGWEWNDFFKEMVVKNSVVVDREIFLKKDNQRFGRCPLEYQVDRFR